MKTMGQSMREAREKAGLTLSGLADMSGVLVSSLGRYERDVTIPGIMNLVSLTDVLEISIDEYIGRNPFGRNATDFEIGQEDFDA